jgi:hypothetical protein
MSTNESCTQQDVEIEPGGVEDTGEAGPDRAELKAERIQEESTDPAPVLTDQPG